MNCIHLFLIILVMISTTRFVDSNKKVLLLMVQGPTTPFLEMWNNNSLYNTSMEYINLNMTGFIANGNYRSPLIDVWVSNPPEKVSLEIWNASGTRLWFVDFIVGHDPDPEQWMKTSNVISSFQSELLSSLNFTFNSPWSIAAVNDLNMTCFYIYQNISSKTQTFFYLENPNITLPVSTQGPITKWAYKFPAFVPGSGVNGTTFYYDFQRLDQMISISFRPISSSYDYHYNLYYSKLSCLNSSVFSPYLNEYGNIAVLRVRGFSDPEYTFSDTITARCLKFIFTEPHSVGLVINYMYFADGFSSGYALSLSGIFPDMATTTTTDEISTATSVETSSLGMTHFSLSTLETTQSSLSTYVATSLPSLTLPETSSSKLTTWTKKSITKTKTTTTLSTLETTNAPLTTAEATSIITYSITTLEMTTSMTTIAQFTTLETASAPSIVLGTTIAPLTALDTTDALSTTAPVTNSKSEQPTTEILEMPPPTTTTTVTPADGTTLTSFSKKITTIPIINHSSTTIVFNSNKSFSCFCACNKTLWNPNPTNVKGITVLQLRKQLLVNKTLLSSHFRKLNSVLESRTSAMALGVLGGAILLVTFSMFILSDITNISAILKGCQRNRYKESSKK